MQGLEEDASELEVRNGDVSNHGIEQRNAHSQHGVRGRRWLEGIEDKAPHNY